MRGKRNTKEERRVDRQENVCYLLMSGPSLCNKISLLPGEVKAKKFIYQLSLVSHLQFITATPGDVPPHLRSNQLPVQAAAG